MMTGQTPTEIPEWKTVACIIFVIVLCVLSFSSGFAWERQCTVQKATNDLESCNRTLPIRSAVITSYDANGQIIGIRFYLCTYLRL